jgi:uncharacterized protein
MYYKSISDPIYGLISLDPLASDLLSTRAMQRLHNVHQLGLAYMVFPSAKYTRHAHSIGAYRNAVKIIEAIQKNSHEKKIISEEYIKICKIIALMHDVGHYPFSHATEHAIQDYCDKNLIQPENEFVSCGDIENTKYSCMNHEKMGEYIISHDKEVSSVIRRHGLDPEKVSSCFAGNDPEFKLLGIVSSDLDCDRLDYLRRTSHASGAPYGSVDIDFLIENATMDEEGNFCFKDKAARAADHLLVSRFYDYMQVPFNKTAIAIEWSLLECLKEALKQGEINATSSSMEKLVNSGDWLSFDDQYVMSIFRNILKNSIHDNVLIDHFKAIQQRRPAKLIASWNQLRYRRDISIDEIPKIDDDPGNTYRANYEIKKRLDHLIEIVASECGIDSRRLYVWNATVKFMKDGQELDNISQSEPEYYAEGVHLLNPKYSRASRIGLRKDMLISKLKDQYMSGLRLYYLPEHSDYENDYISEISKKILSSLDKNEMTRPTMTT